LISLNPDLFIGKGRERICYRHPLDKGKCIKIVHHPSPRTASRIKREEKYHYRYLQNDPKCKFIPKFYGQIKTNLGHGQVFELITDHNGSISEKLIDCVQQEVAFIKLEEKVLDLFRGFLEMKALVSDFHPSNVVIRRLSEDEFELVVIDGFGNSDFIKIADHVPYFRRKKLIRKFRRFMLMLKLSPHSIK